MQSNYLLSIDGRAVASSDALNTLIVNFWPLFHQRTNNVFRGQVDETTAPLFGTASQAIKKQGVYTKAIPAGANSIVVNFMRVVYLPDSRKK